ncbi:ATP-binding protein [Tropicimonas sp. TH_r6]|uniref:ATP-binding protein n=1 Tax=Tropicimonas sp. TH_r6 TaxID=3082085 RepID=UPI002953042D|nr:ATP-binding protein [Tropicimonas sp. TH_r6]MDV7141196.1 ATP-binding protein [Tropicimonas sp. TH_r6]
MPEVSVRRKWRPPLWLLIAALVALLTALPLVGLVMARLADDQFLRETERSLIDQAAILAALHADALARAKAEDLPGNPLSDAARTRLAEDFHPVEPRLSLADAEIDPPAEAAEGPGGALHPDHERLAAPLSELAQSVQKTTLVGYRFTDSEGRVIASSGEGIGRSLAHLPEVSAALAGEVATRLRYRKPLETRDRIGSISRDTLFRVHVAHPVILGDRVVGAVQLSRTPDGLMDFLYRERAPLTGMLAGMAVVALLVGFVFWRTISAPIHALRDQSQEVARGARPAPEPLRHYGMRELAELGEGLLSMAASLSERSEAIGTYTQHVTHELKSPVTTIVGAAELLQMAGERLEPEQRSRLLAQIHAEGLRMDALLSRLRELARVRSFSGAESCDLQAGVKRMRSAFPELELSVSAPDGWRVALSEDELEIVLTQLLRNAAEHGAGKVALDVRPEAQSLILRDNGAGISPANAARLFDPFFTTRREAGGTGMGLAIVVAILERRGGRISLEDTAQGAAFRLYLPTELRGA